MKMHSADKAHVMYYVMMYKNTSEVSGNVEHNTMRFPHRLYN